MYLSRWWLSKTRINVFLGALDELDDIKKKYNGLPKKHERESIGNLLTYCPINSEKQKKIISKSINIFKISIFSKK